MLFRAWSLALLFGVVTACGARTSPLGGSDGAGASGASGTSAGTGSGASSGAGGSSGGHSGGAGVGGEVSVTAVVLAAGEAHNCALVRGRVKCWGFNASGVLGVGDTEHRGDDQGEMGAALPLLAFGGERTPVALSVGLYHACVISVRGELYCWGHNDSGQLGQGDAEYRGDEPGEVGPSLLPVALGAGRRVVRVAAGLRHTCALLDDGSVKCWGWNYKGELGLGDRAFRGFRGVRSEEMGDALPAVDLGGGPVVDLRVGSSHTCALLGDGRVKCWGQNAHGELGLGDAEGRGDEPGEMGTALLDLPFGFNRSARSLSVGRYHSCVVLDDGSVKCWGHNAYGQLGVGDVVARGSVVGDMGDSLPAVPLGMRALAVSAGGNHSCALLEDGSVKCWGENSLGQLGQGDRVTRGDEPGELDALRPVDLGGERALQVTTGYSHTCVLLRGDRVRCWGNNVYGALGRGDGLPRGDEPGELGAELPDVDLAL